MSKSEIVVALDIGTTKVCSLVAEVSGEDQIDVQGAGTVGCTGLRKGVIVDLAATTSAIREALRVVEQMSRVHIASVYVGITGEHLDSLNSRAEIPIDGEIQEEHVRAVRLAARRISLPQDREILHNVTRQFIVDGQEGVRHPVGMSATRLGVETHVVTAATSFVENVVKCVQRARVQIEELVAEPLASGLAVLTDAERQLGVLLADIGGGTTDTTIFSGGTVTHTRIIPVGGNHVTADLGLAFRLAPEDAEKAKIESGAARFEDVEPTEYVEIRMIGEEQPREIPRRLLTEIIRPRMEQIFCLLRDHVDAAAADGIHVTSVVITGGGSQLPGAVELGQQILELPVRIGRPRELIDSRGLAVSPACATAAGLLVYAAERMQGMKRRREPRSLPAAAMRLLLGWIRGLRRR